MPDSSSSRFKAFTSTGPGLESIAAGELKALGIRGRQEVGGVAFGADLQQLYEANLWLRTATRVLVRLGSFHASTFYELERRAKNCAGRIDGGAEDRIVRAADRGGERWSYFSLALASCIKVTEEMPREVYELMDLFPQASQRRPSVEFIPLPYTAPPPAVRPRGDR